MLFEIRKSLSLIVEQAYTPPMGVLESKEEMEGARIRIRPGFGSGTHWFS